MTHFYEKAQRANQPQDVFPWQDYVKNYLPTFLAQRGTTAGLPDQFKYVGMDYSALPHTNREYVDIVANGAEIIYQEGQQEPIFGDNYLTMVPDIPFDTKYQEKIGNFLELSGYYDSYPSNYKYYPEPANPKDGYY